MAKNQHNNKKINKLLDKDNKRIIITDEKHGLPYSKGLMASSIMATGLPPSRSYQVAQLVQESLIAKGRFSINIEELRKLTSETLFNIVGEGYAHKYEKWQLLSKLNKPIIILIGGTTGVGKSTIAAEIAHRLGITRIISTDSIREVMRAIFSTELMPALYNSSFDAWKNLRVPLPKSSDPIIIGFREQASAVATGVNALIQRSITEGTNVIIEGVHLAPGFIDTSLYKKKAMVFPMIITVDDENLHRSHFYIRELETEGFRPFKRYRANFDNIRKIGEFIETLAKGAGVRVICSTNLDQSIAEVLEEILSKVIVGKSREKPSKKVKIDALSIKTE